MSDLDDILGCTGVVPAVREQIPLVQTRPKADPIRKYAAPRYANQTQEEAEAEYLEKEKKWFNTAQLKSGKVSQFLWKDEEGYCWLYIIGPRIWFGKYHKQTAAEKACHTEKKPTFKIREVDWITFSVYNQIPKADGGVNAEGRIYVRIPINPYTYAQVPLYEVDGN